jgi:hypothetical protein
MLAPTKRFAKAETAATSPVPRVVRGTGEKRAAHSVYAALAPDELGQWLPTLRTSAPRG